MEILYSADAPVLRETKQIVRLSGAQQGEDSSSRVCVSCFKFPPSRSLTYKSGLPLLLKIIASFFQSGETAGLMFEPLKCATAFRAPVVRLCEKMSGLPFL